MNSAPRKSIQSAITMMQSQFDEELTWGVRFDTEGLPVGHVFPASRVWVDGEPTDETLRGTCCVAANDLASIHGEYLGTCYIVAGYKVGYGQDPGEVLLEECEVMATL